MDCHCIKLMHAVLLWVIAAAAAAGTASAQTIAPDCQATCGGVTIPYPFGTTEGCYLNRNYLITCNNTFSPPKPFLRTGNIEVLNISLVDHYLRVLTPVGSDCYNEKGGRRQVTASTTLSRFPFSNTRNKFTAIGCDTFAVIMNGMNGQSISTGCLSMCDSIQSVTNGSCSGIGCCQTSIPKGLLNFNVTVSSFSNHSDILSFNPCSYTFLTEEDSFNFSSADLIDLQNRSHVPTVLDWAVGEQTCEEAQKNLTSFACQANSICFDSNNDYGYQCNCSAGYQGNPYLPSGCQDIDECGDPNLNQCTKNCINTLGSYTCSCPKGYHGDGRQDGEGCIADDQLLAIKIAIGISIGFLALIIGSSWLYWIHKRRKFIKLKEKFFWQNGGLMLQQQLSGQDGSNETVKIFTAEELEKATNKYDEGKIIGTGGYGTVYKGILVDGRTVAIKKSKIVDQSQIEQFINEVVILSQINHRNVVKLLGCCLETEVPLLVYEFITNGTLFDHIHDEGKASNISWEARLRIAAETAEVLSYLHSAASIPIIHRDVKSNNILLDDNYTAKVSDFGASRLVPMDQSQLSTMVQGTLGYLDPEYLQTSQLTEKSDVYSFGVVLVELLTGKQVLSSDRSEEQRSLAMYFLSSLKEDRLFQVLENYIMKDENTQQIKEVATLAKKCLRVKGEERPTMKDVTMELERIRKMKNNRWIDVDLNSEMEYLFSKPSGAYIHDGSNSTTLAYDSMKYHVISPVNDGR